MRMLECRKAVHVFGLVAALAIGSCGGSSPSPDPVACEEQQRDFVDRVIAPDQQTDVAATVQAVFSAPDVLQSIPYCSGTRPGP